MDAAALATRAGLTAAVKTIARNFLIEKAATWALTPVMSKAMAWAEDAGVNPLWLQAGMLALQASSALKVLKPRCIGGACFVAGTQVVTAIDMNGQYITKNIEDIKTGDLVLSRDQYDESDDVSPHLVTETFVHTVDHVRVLSVRNADGEVETIRTTDNHPFYVEGLGWTSAGELRAGQQLNEADDSNDAVVISSHREEHPEGIAVYNFTVDGDHAYFVVDGTEAADALWVHNDCDFRSKVFDYWEARLKRKLPKKSQAHHIIPQNVEGAEDLRIFLSDHGIDIHDTANGIPLPAKLHRAPSGVHGADYEYISALEDRLFPLAGSSADRIREELREIGHDLLTNRFEY